MRYIFVFIFDMFGVFVLLILDCEFALSAVIIQIYEYLGQWFFGVPKAVAALY